MGLQPDVMTYSTLISACGKGMIIEKAPQLIDEMLFDHRTDPLEASNLAYSASHRDIVHALRGVALCDWRAAAR